MPLPPASMLRLILLTFHTALPVADASEALRRHFARAYACCGDSTSEASDGLARVMTVYSRANFAARCRRAPAFAAYGMGAFQEARR